jgi:hypothetical protein
LNKTHPFSAACRFGAAFLFALGVLLVPAQAATKVPTPKITIASGGQPTAKVEISAINMSPTISVSATLSPSGTLVYQWFNGKTAIIGANASSLAVTAAGSYTCKITGGTAKAVTSKASKVTNSFAPAVLPEGMKIIVDANTTTNINTTIDGKSTKTKYSGTYQGGYEVAYATDQIMSLLFVDPDTGEAFTDDTYTYTYTYKRVSSNKGIIKTTQHVKYEDVTDEATETLTITFTGFNKGTLVLVGTGNSSGTLYDEVDDSDKAYTKTYNGKGRGTFTVDYAN